VRGEGRANFTTKSRDVIYRSALYTREKSQAHQKRFVVMTILLVAT